MSDNPHLACPYTDCASSDAFNWSDDGFGFCHSCSSSYPSTDRKEVFEWAKSSYPLKQRINPMTAEIAGLTYKGIRGLDEDVAKLYGIQVQTLADGTPVRYAYKYPHTVKYRDYNDKSKSWIKDKGVGMNHFFGPEFNSGSSKRIYLTEGEFDAASLYQILGQTYPVKSLPSASIGDKFLKANHAYLTNFQEIVYAGELDDAGRRAAEKLYAAFPEKFYYVPMSKHKDANDFLTSGDGNDLKWAALKPQRYSPENFFVSLDKFEQILREETPYEFVPTPCAGLNESINGHTKGGMTLYKAFPGTGKTALFRYFQYDLLKNTDQKIAVLHLEESKSTTLRGLASYALGKNVSTKIAAEESGVTEQEVADSLKSFVREDNLILFEFTPTDYDDIFGATLRYLRLAITAYGADYIFLDHVQRLAYMAGVEDATRNLTTFAVKAEDMCREYNVGFNCISHLNSEGAVKYAKSLEEACIIAIDINRDKESEDEVVQNTIELNIPGKNRPWAKLGAAGKLFYDRETTLLSELQGDF
jgi:twinkle protein